MLFYNFYFTSKTSCDGPVVLQCLSFLPLLTLLLYTFLRAFQTNPNAPASTIHKRPVARCSTKQFLKISQNLRENNVLEHNSACNLIKKEALALVFSREFFKIFKINLFTEHPRQKLLNIMRKLFFLSGFSCTDTDD